MMKWGGSKKAVSASKPRVFDGPVGNLSESRTALELVRKVEKLNLHPQKEELNLHHALRYLGFSQEEARPVLKQVARELTPSSLEDMERNAAFLDRAYSAHYNKTAFGPLYGRRFSDEERAKLAKSVAQAMALRKEYLAKFGITTQR